MKRLDGTGRDGNECCGNARRRTDSSYSTRETREAVCFACEWGSRPAAALQVSEPTAAGKPQVKAGIGTGDWKAFSLILRPQKLTLRLQFGYFSLITFMPIDKIWRIQLRLHAFRLAVLPRLSAFLPHQRAKILTLQFTGERRDAECWRHWSCAVVDDNDSMIDGCVSTHQRCVLKMTPFSRIARRQLSKALKLAP